MKKLLGWVGKMTKGGPLRKALLAIFLALGLAGAAYAQQPNTLNLTAQSSDCSTANSCNVVLLGPNIGGVTFTADGTWSGTVQIEATGNNNKWVALSATPSNSTTTVTSFTSTGTWQANVAGYTQVRLRVSTYSSGTVVTTITPSTASARGGSGGGGGGTPGGTATQLQFNNTGVFGGVAGSAVTSATGAVTLAAGAVGTTPLTVNSVSSSQTAWLTDLNNASSGGSCEGLLCVRGLGVGNYGITDEQGPALLDLNANCGASCNLWSIIFRNQMAPANSFGNMFFDDDGSFYVGSTGGTPNTTEQTTAYLASGVLQQASAANKYVLSQAGGNNNTTSPVHIINNGCNLGTTTLYGQLALCGPGSQAHPDQGSPGLLELRETTATGEFGWLIDNSNAANSYFAGQLIFTSSHPHGILDYWDGSNEDTLDEVPGTGYSWNSGKWTLSSSGTQALTASGAASTPRFSMTGTPFAGTGTTSVPLAYINAGTAPSSWSTSGTEFGVNAASGFAGNFLDLHLNGGASLASINSVGTISGAALNSTGNITAGAGNLIGWTGRSISSSPADGQIRLTNAAATDFTRLEFGGTTSSFPALKRNSTALNVRLADDSADAPLTSGPMTINGGTQIQKVLSATATLDFGSLVSIGCEDLTITVTGAAVGDTVALGVPNGSVPSATFWYTGWVSTTNTVTVRGCTLVSGDPASGTFRATVMQF